MSKKIDLTHELLSKTSKQAEEAACWIEELDTSKEVSGKWSAKIPIRLIVSISSLSSVVLFMDSVIGPHGWWRRVGPFD